MKKILTLVWFFLYAFSYAQEVKVIEQNEDYIKKETGEKFEFIDDSFDLTNYEKIVVLEGHTINSGKNTLVSLFNHFWETANDYGANAYKIDKVETISGAFHVCISAYYLDEKAFDANFNLYPKNKIYVFGDLDVKKGKAKKITINKQKVELSPLEHISYQNEVGKYATVSIGGLLGAKVDIFGKEERLPVYLSLNGFGVGPGNYNEISLSFNTGRIYPVDMNFGQFLINILTEKQSY
jgi:hypothetical protein